MAKKQKPKAKKQKPVQKVGGGGGSDDYGNVLRFLFAGVTDPGFRNDVGTGNKATIEAALTSVGISFPNAADFDAVVLACQNVQAVAGAWNVFDNLRVKLLGPGSGTGAA